MKNIDEKIQYVLKNVFDDKKITTYLKRLKSRIKQSLQKEFSKREDGLSGSDEEQIFLDNLVDHFKAKFFKQDSKVALIPTDSIEENHDGSSRNNQVHPISSEIVKFRDASQKYHEIHLVRQIRCLKEMVEMLRGTVQRKDDALQKEKQNKRKIITDNKLLTYRSKELTRLKMQPYISPRSVLLVDTATYSDFLGYIDNVILETSFKLVEIKDFQLKGCVKFRGGLFREVYMYDLKSGETVVMKKVSTNMKFSEEKSLSVLSVEARISLLLSRHENIVDYHGIFQHMSTFIVQSLEPKYLLKDFFFDKRRFDVFKLSSILRGIVSAVTFMHEKGVLNNNIRHDNIALRCTSFSVTPVLLSLSLACRVNSSKSFTISQQMRYEVSLHLPPKVRKGLEPPSFASDRYALGFIIGNVIGTMRLMKEVVSDELDKLHRRCFRMDRKTSVEDFSRIMYEICDEMEC